MLLSFGLFAGVSIGKVYADSLDWCNHWATSPIKYCVGVFHGGTYQYGGGHSTYLIPHSGDEPSVPKDLNSISEFETFINNLLAAGGQQRMAGSMVINTMLGEGDTVGSATLRTANGAEYNKWKQVVEQFSSTGSAVPGYNVDWQYRYNAYNHPNSAFSNDLQDVVWHWNVDPSETNEHMIRFTWPKADGGTGVFMMDRNCGNLAGDWVPLTTHPIWGTMHANGSKSGPDSNPNDTNSNPVLKIKVTDENNRTTTTTVNPGDTPATVPIGAQLTWVHNFWDSGRLNDGTPAKAQTDNITLKAMWTGDKSNAWQSVKKTFIYGGPNNNNKVLNDTYSVKKADAGKKLCQYSYVSEQSTFNSNPINDSAPLPRNLACVIVEGTPPPGSGVTVDSDITDPSQAEIGTPGTIKGLLTVDDSDNFPTSDNWGYNNLAAQGTMSRTTAHEYGNNYSVGRLNGQPSYRYTYSCNTGDPAASPSIGNQTYSPPNCTHSYSATCVLGGTLAGNKCTWSWDQTSTTVGGATAPLGSGGGCAYLNNAGADPTYSKTGTGDSAYCKQGTRTTWSGCGTTGTAGPNHTCSSSYNATCTSGDGSPNTSGICTHTYIASYGVDYWYLCSDGVHQSSNWNQAPSCAGLWSCVPGVNQDDAARSNLLSGTHWGDYSYNQPTCNTWQCPYTAQNVFGTSPYVSGSTSVLASTGQPSNTNCEYRCAVSGNGTGHLPWVPTGDYSAVQKSITGNVSAPPCYQPPQFSVTCTMTTSGINYTVTNVTNQTIAITGLLDSTPCGSASGTSNTVSGQFCASMKPSLAAGWGVASYASGTIDGGFAVPGTVNGTAPTTANNPYRLVSFVPSVAGPSCDTFYAAAYFKVYNGDVATGTASNAGGACDANGAAKISAFGNSNGTGAGMQYSASATGVLSGLVSGAFNNYAANNPSSPNHYGPGSLTFATSPAGNFSAPGCLDVNQVSVTDQGDVTINGSTITHPDGSTTALDFSGGKVVTLRVDGSVDITGNISFGSYNASDINGIPGLQIIASNDIKIEPNVTEVDGLFVAGGTISDCPGNDTSFDPNSTDNECSNQLVINGAFMANTIHLQRDYGSRVCSQANELTLPNQYVARTYGATSTGDIQCDTSTGANNAAEIFNFTPEQWIRGAGAAVTNNDYDAISNMPPIL